MNETIVIEPHASDADLWEYAKVRNLVIVTKDTDFSDRMLVSEPPPWVVHLRFGNLRRGVFYAFLERLWPRVEGLLADNKLVHVYLDRIETVSCRLHLDVKNFNKALAMSLPFDSLSLPRFIA